MEPDLESVLSDLRRQIQAVFKMRETAKASHIQAVMKNEDDFRHLTRMTEECHSLRRLASLATVLVSGVGKSRQSQDP